MPVKSSSKETCGSNSEACGVPIPNSVGCVECVNGVLNFTDSSDLTSTAMSFSPNAISVTITDGVTTNGPLEFDAGSKVVLDTSGLVVNLPWTITQVTSANSCGQLTSHTSVLQFEACV